MNTFYCRNPNVDPIPNEDPIIRIDIIVPARINVLFAPNLLAITGVTNKKIASKKCLNCS